MKIVTQTVGVHDAPLTAYLLSSSDEMRTDVRPAVLILPGGGYFFTSDREAEPVAVAYLAEGYNAFVLRYSTGADAPFEHSPADAVAALAAIRARSTGFGVDPKRVAAVGFSAGGHLASALGTVCDARRRVADPGCQCHSSTDIRSGLSGDARDSA